MKRVLPILLLGLALRVGLFYSAPRLILGDAYHHVNLALNMVRGHGFSHSPAPPFYPDAQRAPLLPACLAALIALGGTPVVTMLFQSLLDLGTGLILYGRLKRYSLSWATLALALYLLAPYPAFFPSMELTECLAVFFFTLTLERCWRLYEAPGPGNAFWLGLSAAFLALSRPAMLPIAFLLILGVARRRHLVLALATTVVLLLPWSARNASIPGGSFTPLTPASGGLTLWYGVTKDRDVNLTGGEGEELFQRYLVQWQPPQDLSSDEAIHIDQQLKAIAVKAILAHPVEYAGHAVMQAVRFWWDADDALINAPTPHPGLMALAQWSQRLLLVLALLGLCDRRAWPAWLILLALTGEYSLIHVESRYALPAEPILAAAAAWFLLRLLRPSPADPSAPG